MACHSIALPLSPSFPAHELQYILNNSQATILASSAKFETKASEVMQEGLENNPSMLKLEKKLGGQASEPLPTFEGSPEGPGGMMLFTSGTTSRPVRPFSSEK
jgi:acyl-CoA synthetase (AMP-forming)/AMP-acid ligase II